MVRGSVSVCFSRSMHLKLENVRRRASRFSSAGRAEPGHRSGELIHYQPGKRYAHRLGGHRPYRSGSTEVRVLLCREHLDGVNGRPVLGGLDRLLPGFLVPFLIIWSR